MKRMVCRILSILTDSTGSPFIDFIVMTIMIHIDILVLMIYPEYQDKMRVNMYPVEVL